MNKNNIIIRLEKREDHREVENLIRESFWNVYCPGCNEHYLMHVLRDADVCIKKLNFVMEKDGEIIGQNVFAKTIIVADDGREIPVLTMGPICITPELKRKGYGKMLLDYSLEDADSSFFLCKELIPGYLDGITGVYQTPDIYYVPDDKVDEFDKGFPSKEKLKLPGQIF